MDYTAHTSPPINTSRQFSASPSLPSHVLSLCPTAATLFFLPSVYTILFLTAVPGNVLSLWVFLRRISTTSPTHVYLSHLSVSNLMLSLTTPFLAAYFACGSFWTLSSVLCQLVLHLITPVLHINIYIGLMILTWVALSRFAALVQHTHASKPNTCITLLPHSFFTRLKRVSFARKVCGAVWLLAVGGIVPVTVFYSVREVISGDSTKTGEDIMCYNPAVEVGGGLSAACNVSAITVFFVCYLLVLLSYMSVLKHIWRSRRSTNVITSQSLLGRVLRNIIVIQVVLSACLLPYHIYKPIFISLAYQQSAHSPEPGTHCHPLSTHVEVKNGLLLLAALRGSTDPVMYFLLDKTFRQQTFRLLGFDQNAPVKKQPCWSVTGSLSPRPGQLGVGNEPTATMGSSRESVL
ncbi:probable G-protein coupled receptor 82 [Sphaeramia orbicularis]|uniref:G-protein coupled receptors family 1 profile domain-containing protein n=1 Tax=Sphaeramia orbicularis TaxID=375764 RepID=A0A673CG46_9TELE|nr:probable G-protein coupled receptor 82 [Sphaeramia orbicularis]